MSDDMTDDEVADMDRAYERNLAARARSRFEVEWMAHDFEDAHWQGLFWVSLHPQPFAFPDGGGAHGMLVAHYRLVESPTNDAPYWKLSSRGDLVMAYLDAVIQQLGLRGLKRLREWVAATREDPVVFGVHGRNGPPPEIMPLMRALAIEIDKGNDAVAVWPSPFGRALIRRVDLVNMEP